MTRTHRTQVQTHRLTQHLTKHLTNLRHPMQSNDSRLVPDATKEKSTNNPDNPTVTDVPKVDLTDKRGDVSKGAKNSNTVAGSAKKPASTEGQTKDSHVAPIVKQNQDTDQPAISVVPPVYGHKGIKDITKAKTDWEVAEAKMEARYGLPLLDTKSKEERKQLLEDEYRRLHNGSLTEDVMTNHWNNEPQEYHGSVKAPA